LDTRASGRCGDDAAGGEHSQLLLEAVAAQGPGGVGGMANDGRRFFGKGIAEQGAIGRAPRPRGVAQRDNKGMVADQPVGHALGMAMPTGPAVLGRMRHHPCPHRVQFDISAAGQQILLAIHGRRFEAAFPQGAAAADGRR